MSASFEVVSTSAAPAAVGPYSQAVATGELVFASGQISLDPASGELRGKTAAEQARQVMINLKAVLEAAESSLTSVLKTTIFLTDMTAFQEVNEVYSQALGEHRPARSTVGVASLPKGALVEIEAVALRAC
jgi:2-iminobutanoate/2-iminopropanoate deaminase